MQVNAQAHLPLPTTATCLVTELTLFLLALAPYLDTLDEAGMTVPARLSAATGIAKICPG